MRAIKNVSGLACRPRQNRILDALPVAVEKRLFPRLELVELSLGMVLNESGDTPRHVYFPTDSIVSLLYAMEDGASAEVSVVGKEGMVGVALFLEGNSMPSRAVVVTPGHAYRLSARALREEFQRHEDVLHVLLRYTQVLMTQIAQTAVCNRHHSVLQQLCRWLLLSLDRLDSDEVMMTQELIANMLGVRREGITEAAGKLQKAGVIKYARGRIRVLDRERLESMCCECYSVIDRETERLLKVPSGEVKYLARSG